MRELEQVDLDPALWPHGRPLAGGLLTPESVSAFFARLQVIFTMKVVQNYSPAETEPEQSWAVLHVALERGQKPW